MIIISIKRRCSLLLELGGATKSHDSTVRGGARMRMTYRASQQFTPQFCGLSRRVMHTWRLCRVRTLDLKPSERRYVHFLFHARKQLAKKQTRETVCTNSREGLTECRARTAGNGRRWKWPSHPGWSLPAGELRATTKSWTTMHLMMQFWPYNKGACWSISNPHENLKLKKEGSYYVKL